MGHSSRVLIEEGASEVQVELYSTVGYRSTTTYNTLEETPEWIQGAIAVLEIAENKRVDGVGYKIRIDGDRIWWVDKPEEVSDE